MILNRNERLLTQAHPRRQDERMQGQMICPAQQLPEAKGSQKKAYEAIHRLPLRGDHLGLFPQCMRDSPDSPRNSLAKFTCGLTAEFTCEIHLRNHWPTYATRDKWGCSTLAQVGKTITEDRRLSHPDKEITLYEPRLGTAYATARCSPRLQLTSAAQLRDVHAHQSKTRSPSCG